MLKWRAQSKILWSLSLSKPQYRCKGFGKSYKPILSNELTVLGIDTKLIVHLNDRGVENVMV